MRLGRNIIKVFKRVGNNPLEGWKHCAYLDDIVKCLVPGMLSTRITRLGEAHSSTPDKKAQKMSSQHDDLGHVVGQGMYLTPQTKKQVGHVLLGDCGVL